MSLCPQKQMRSLYSVRHLRVRRLLERLVLAPYGGAPITCRKCQETCRLGVRHLEGCAGAALSTHVLGCRWLPAGAALCGALAVCRGDPLYDAQTWCHQEMEARPCRPVAGRRKAPSALARRR